MRNVLVTGGAGFIGSHTVVELIAAGYKPVIIDDFSNSKKSVLDGLEKITGQKIKTYEHDYKDAKKLEEILNNEKVDGVIHFAAFKAVGESVAKPLEYYNNNVSGLVTLLQTMEKSKVPSLVFSSSCTVYGEPDRLPVTEDMPFKPAVSPYGATKQICETIVRDAIVASKNLKGLSLRYFNPIGAHRSALIGELPIGIPNNLVPFITQAAAGIHKQLTVYGNDYDTPDGTNIRDYIHVVDLAKAHVMALDHLLKKSAGYYDAINIGTGRGNSVMEVIKTFEKVTGKMVPYKIGQRRAGDVVKVYASAAKAKKTLGWQAQKTLDEALADAWRWQQAISRAT